MDLMQREKLRLVRQLLDEILGATVAVDAIGTAAVDRLETPDRAPEFAAHCVKCERAIHWAVTENGKKAALDQRPGPYVLSADMAVFEGGLRGYAYHYDGTPQGCPAQPRDGSDEDPPRREWQDVYDK